MVARGLEQRVEEIFHTDSDGYRVGRSAIDAVAKCRQRCWETDWVLDLDIQAFFDSCPHDLLVKAVAANTNHPWVVLYVKRWLTAPIQHPDGTLHERDRGTPQGSAVSPVLANLFLHYAFDTWMARKFPSIRFERYVDDVVVHCRSQRQARMLQTAVGQRLAEVGLRLHLTKTKGARLAAAPAHQRHAGRPRGSDQPDRAGLDELLGPLLPDPDDPPPEAHQYLPDAVGPQEVQAAVGVQTPQGVVAAGGATDP